MNPKYRIEFFHDAVCGWCYIQSPILRKLADEGLVEVHHRAFVLQRNDHEMKLRFGSLENAKKEILNHWQSCQRFEGTRRFNIEGMRAAPFNYPSGLLAAKGAKAAELLGGQDTHWDFFDLVQQEHLQRANNIGAIDTLLGVASCLGFDTVEFEQTMHSDEVEAGLESDRKRAERFDIRSIPSMIVDDRYLVGKTTKYSDLVRLLARLRPSNHV
ncbi:DsbA family oxidoreductase [Marinobacterium aestuariivivens]|uniref:DsbA family protein n=1 Tax=Marinobacterium aestuariivivens TaxID=1698799 RepID=A0ABW1ZXW8_9GAMM